MRYDDRKKMAERRWRAEGSPEAAAAYLGLLDREGINYRAIQDSKLLDYDALHLMQSKHADLFDRLPDNPQGRPEFRHKQTGAVFVMLPAGRYRMGSTDGDRDEQPVHTVVIEYPLLMQKHPLTQEQWERVMGNNPSHFKTGPTHPVESVSWYDCQEFTKKTADEHGERALELPSETVWEYACRAGTETRFHSAWDDAPGQGGDSEDHLAKIAVFGRSWEEGHEACYDPETGVPTRQVNDFGLAHMLGQVWEWCEDEYHESYNGAPPDSRPWTEQWDREREFLLGKAADYGYIVAPNVAKDGEENPVIKVSDEIWRGDKWPSKVEVESDPAPGVALDIEQINALLRYMIAQNELDAFDKKYEKEYEKKGVRRRRRGEYNVDKKAGVK